LESTCRFARCGKYDTSFEPAVAVQELLRGSKWSLVQLFGAFHEAEAPAKLGVKRFSAETHTVNKEFWLALRDAAAKMELYDRARRYERFANSPEATP
jgi:hypothetical protein